MRYLVSFKNNEQEKQQEEWIKEKSLIVGFSSFMKQLAYEEKLREEKEVKNDNSNLDFDFTGGF